MKKIISVLCLIVFFSSININAISAAKDIKAPVIVSTNPVNNSIDVELSANIKVVFSETIKKGVNFTKIKLTDDKKISIKIVPGIKKNTLTIDHATKFKNNVLYTLTIPKNAFTDASGNGLKKDFVLKFRTVSKQKTTPAAPVTETTTSPALTVAPAPNTNTTPTPPPVPTNEIVDSFIKTTPQMESDHFIFYCNDADVKCLEDLKKSLEDNYSRITSDLKCSFDYKPKVMIYPDIDIYHKAINSVNAPDWSVGRAVGNDIKMVSPLNPGKAHTYNTLITVVVHEFTHLAVMRNNGYSVPRWLNEGTATYEANQMTQNAKQNLHIRIASNQIPSLDQFETQNFGNNGEYDLSYTIIEYIVKNHGYDKLVALIKSPNDFQGVFGFNNKQFEDNWKSFLKTNY